MSGMYCSPWSLGWRRNALRRLDQHWDVIVIGGGITGAGILAVAVRNGLRALLLEKSDFAAGTSSRSSKLVHGGLRYLKHMQIKLTRESVQERQYLLRAARGLVEPLGFIYPVYKGDRPSPWVIQLGLGIYTRLAADAGKYRRLDEEDISFLAPGLKVQNLERGFYYADAQTDDARLVLRLLHDALIFSEGKALAFNYCPVTGLVREGGQVKGVRVLDVSSGVPFEVRGEVVINATGVWADELRGKAGARRRLRPLRGSHLFFDFKRFPIYQAIAFSHPDDGRPVFVYPWENVTLAGTTDVDHGLPLDREPSISPEEANYLLRAVQSLFPELELDKRDVISTHAGVRPVISRGKKDPSEESREHVVWQDGGLLTVTGGKLTTFRPIAVDVLREAHKMNKAIPDPKDDVDLFEPLEPDCIVRQIGLPKARRLCGRYGAGAVDLITSHPNPMAEIEGTPYLWAELAWSAMNEGVEHLDDLLLRRFRLGIILPDGGASLLPGLMPIIQNTLGWDDARWTDEVARFKSIWKMAHSVPDEWRKN